MFRLAHISDIHLGPLPRIKRRELFSKRITGYVNFRRNRSSNLHPEITARLINHLGTLEADHTAITGDLINLGLDSEIATAKAWLRSLGSPEDHTVVLGNHDAYIRGARGRAMESWQDWINGDDKALIKSEAQYPILRRRGKISIIGCNSARASAPFLATGYFKKKQAEGLQKLLREERRQNQCCIVLIHHAPQKDATSRYKRLLGATRFRDVIAQEGADLVLHGHTHLDTLTYIDASSAQVPVVCVPAAYQWAGYRKPPAGLNLFKITRKQQDWSIALERHGLEPSAGQDFQKTFDEVISRI